MRAGTVPGCVIDGELQTGEGRKWLRLPEWEWLANGTMASLFSQSVRAHRRAWRHHSCGVFGPSAIPPVPNTTDFSQGLAEPVLPASCHHLRPRTELRPSRGSGVRKSRPHPPLCGCPLPYPDPSRRGFRRLKSTRSPDDTKGRVGHGMGGQRVPAPGLGATALSSLLCQASEASLQEPCQ